MARRAVAVVSVQPGEPVERALKRLDRFLGRSGVLQELRRREHYVKPSVKRRRKQERARTRERRAAARREAWERPDA